MRITYKPVKRVTPAVGKFLNHNFRISPEHSQHPQVASLITTLLETPVNQLADVFESVHTWSYPRSDLHSWIAVLNKLDEIYENIIQEYGLSKLQNKIFCPSSKRLLLGLLRFQRMLLDNSTNRKLFNSYDVSVLRF
jgi:E3 ubiquitin-protein ligase HUWE1